MSGKKISCISCDNQLICCEGCSEMSVCFLLATQLLKMHPFLLFNTTDLVNIILIPCLLVLFSLDVLLVHACIQKFGEVEYLVNRGLKSKLVVNLSIFQMNKSTE